MQNLGFVVVLLLLLWLLVVVRVQDEAASKTIPLGNNDCTQERTTSWHNTKASLEELELHSSGAIVVLHVVLMMMKMAVGWRRSSSGVVYDQAEMTGPPQAGVGMV